MSALRKNLLPAAVAAALVAGVSANASATTVTFTLNPNALFASPVGLPNIVANNMTLSDNAYIAQGGGAFNEYGNFNIAAFNGPSADAPGLNGGAFTCSHGPCYGLYGTYHATGHFDPVHSSSTDGHYIVDSISLTLYGDPGHDTNLAVPSGIGSFGVSGTTSNDIVLGTGTLLSGSADIFLPTAGTRGGPDFTADINFTPDNTTGFWVSPSVFSLNLLQGNLSATPDETTPNPLTLTSSPITITNGNGSAEFLVPEPGTLGLFGFSLLGLGLLSRRRARKA